MKTTTTRRPRSHDWTTFVATLALLCALAALAAGRPVAGGTFLALAIVAGGMARRSSRSDPGPMPYALRWVLYLPRWPVTVARLRTILAPKAGERLLEVGPGVGIYALPVATTLAPDGSLDAIDVQPEMLGDLVRRAGRAGVTNIITKEGDAMRLPYADATFDGAYLVGVLGEIPDPPTALRELRRVLKPGGRLVVGEVLGADPDAVRLSTLCALADRAGFVLEQRSGPRFGYVARFRPAA